jgi:hypothetical protein
MSSTISGGVRELEIVKKLARGESIKIVGAYGNHFIIGGWMINEDIIDVGAMLKSRQYSTKGCVS